MNIETISMDPKTAAVAFRDYRAAVKLGTDHRRKREDEQVMRAYKAASKGQQVLDLYEVMKAAGLNEAGYPALAVCPAHFERCRVMLSPDGSARFRNAEAMTWRKVDRRREVVLPTGTLPSYDWSRRKNSTEAIALVPTIPPHLRPKHGLSNYHILWEAVWKPAPPVDPLLLKHLGGALYAVLAAWDLSKIEQAVLRGRLTQA